jgi:hypothetical protein
LCGIIADGGIAFLAIEQEPGAERFCQNSQLDKEATQQRRRTDMKVGFLIAAPILLGGPVCAAEPVSFSEDILPIFVGRCIDCHQPGGEGYVKSGLDLSTYEGTMEGTKFGPMVIPEVARFV